MEVVPDNVPVPKQPDELGRPKHPRRHSIAALFMKWKSIPYTEHPDVKRVDKLEFPVGALGALLHNPTSLSPFLCRFDCNELWGDDGLD